MCKRIERVKMNNVKGVAFRLFGRIFNIAFACYSKKD